LSPERATHEPGINPGAGNERLGWSHAIESSSGAITPMQNWPLHDIGVAGRSPAWSGMVEAMVDAIGTANFSQALLVQVNQMLPTGSVSMYLLSRQDEPSLVGSATLQRPDRTSECWQAYRTLHLQDRTFDDAWRVPGASMSHCTLAAFAPAHRSQICDRARSHDRLSLTVCMDDGRLLAINLYRNLGQPGFSADDTGMVAAFSRPFIACVRRHASLSAAKQVPTVTERLRLICPRLTPRELDVLHHLVQGRTYDGVSAATGLSTASVKTYRARAFLKLGIHFRNELNALLVDQGERGAA
jgi:DNA-binding CsgD family transcriptional regulator